MEKQTPKSLYAIKYFIRKRKIINQNIENRNQYLCKTTEQAFHLSLNVIIRNCDRKIKLDRDKLKYLERENNYENL